MIKIPVLTVPKSLKKTLAHVVQSLTHCHHRHVGLRQYYLHYVHLEELWVVCNEEQPLGQKSSLKAHGLDFPAHLPGVMKKSSWFL